MVGTKAVAAQSKEVVGAPHGSVTPIRVGDTVSVSDTYPTRDTHPPCRIRVSEFVMIIWGCLICVGSRCPAKSTLLSIINIIWSQSSFHYLELKTANIVP